MWLMGVEIYSSCGHPNQASCVSPLHLLNLSPATPGGSGLPFFGLYLPSIDGSRFQITPGSSQGAYEPTHRESFHGVSTGYLLKNLVGWRVRVCERGERERELLYAPYPEEPSPTPFLKQCNQPFPLWSSFFIPLQGHLLFTSQPVVWDPLRPKILFICVASAPGTELESLPLMEYWHRRKCKGYFPGVTLFFFTTQ